MLKRSVRRRRMDNHDMMRLPRIAAITFLIIVTVGLALPRQPSQTQARAGAADVETASRHPIADEHHRN